MRPSTTNTDVIELWPVRAVHIFACAVDLTRSLRMRASLHDDVLLDALLEKGLEDKGLEAAVRRADALTKPEKTHRDSAARQRDKMLDVDLRCGSAKPYLYAEHARKRSPKR